MIHFENRFLERIGERPSLLDQFEIADLARKGKYLCIRSSNTRSIHNIPYKGKNIWVIYDSSHRTCVTVLTEDMAKEAIEKAKWWNEIKKTNRKRMHI